jgi:hypothetical protein
VPLLSGSSPEVIGENVRRELRAGRPRAQAIAIALRKAGKKRRKKRKKKACCSACAHGHKCASLRSRA